MTVGDKVHQARASLRGLEGQFETFALDTNDQQAKQMYNQCRQQISQMVNQLENRVNYMEQEEPTYKISNSMQNQNGGGLGQNSQLGMTNSTMMTATNVTGGKKKTR